MRARVIRASDATYARPLRSLGGQGRVCGQGRVVGQGRSAAAPHGPGGDLGAGGEAELGQRVARMGLHGPLGQEQPVEGPAAANGQAEVTVGDQPSVAPKSNPSR